MYATPGSNLLNQAMTAIASQTVLYRKYSSRVLNSQRQYMSAFSEPFPFKGSVQRVPRTQYIEYGLEFQRNYIKIFASLNMVDIDRDASGDQFIYGMRVFQLESQGTWKQQDGWALALAVDIGAAVRDENGKPAFPPSMGATVPPVVVPPENEV